MADVVLAQGLARYIELMRPQGDKPRTLSAERLRSDLNASDLRDASGKVFKKGFLPGEEIPEAGETRPAGGLKTFTTFIVRDGQEIAVRLYHPGAQIQRPGMCYFHGGGFTFGSIESFDVVAAGLAEHTGAVVASVQYRRLPENSYRSAQEDCYAALVWLHDHADDLRIDPSRMAVAGDSVGALLATISSAMARDRDGPRLVCQLLMYGAFALQPSRACYSSSRDPLLTSDRVASFISVYHQQQDASFYPPPLGLSDLSGLPPAIIVTAEHDPLREEGFEYAERLRSAGVPVETATASGMIHGFLRAMKMSPEASRHMKSIAQSAREHLWPIAGEQQ